MSDPAKLKPSVAGERLPLAVPFVLALLGLASAVAAAHLLVHDAAIDAGRVDTVLEEWAASSPSSQAVVEPLAPIEIVKDCAPVFAVCFEHESDTLPLFLASGSDSLSVAPVRSQIQVLVDWLLDHPQTGLVVSGHADSTGDEFFNMLISHRRASFVKKLLLKAGLGDGRVEVRAFGECLPPETEGRTLLNQRRVSLTVPGYEDCQPEE